MSAQVLARYRERAAMETLHELRRHPEAIRYALLAAYAAQRRPEIIDTLVELLKQLVHRIETRAERAIVKTFVADLRRVDGKPRLLYQLAQAALDHPDQTIRAGIYPVVSEEHLRAIVSEYQASAGYHQQVSLRMQASYRHHYRRVIPQLLAALEIRSNNRQHRPVLEALALVRRYAATTDKYYPFDEEIPHHYFALLKQPLQAEAFVAQLQQQMTEALAALDRTLPRNPHVRLLPHKGGWISLSPLEPQAAPVYLPTLKAEIARRWPKTSLLDVLKEADLRIGFTRHFKSAAT